MLRACLLAIVGLGFAAVLGGCPVDMPSDVPDAGRPDAADVPRIDRIETDMSPDVPRDVPGDGDVVGDGGDGGDGGNRCAIDQGYAYGFEGGNTASSDTTALSPARGWTLRRVYADPMRMPDECMTQLPACGVPSAITTGDAMGAILDGDVQHALDDPGPELLVYGIDTRPMDGQVFAFRRVADGHGFYVGEPCAGRPDCRDIPAGLGQLVGLLYALDQQELARPACAMLR